ncbi:MAG: hypothetical protein AAGA56_21210, partial [Myxococcota bacterium]
LRTDRLEMGQWLSGRIYPERCGLSPNGELLVYFCGKFRGEVPTFTAICRPPYFTALALWPGFGTWGGGGFFPSDREVVLNTPAAEGPLDPQALAPGLTVSHRAPREDEVAWPLIEKGSASSPISHSRAERGELRYRYRKPWRYARRCPDLAVEATLERVMRGYGMVDGPFHPEEYHLRIGGAEASEVELGPLDWADWGADGSLLLSHGGRVGRLRLAPEQMRKAREPKRKARRVEPKWVADLCDQRFENIPPSPSAKQWPGYLRA